MYGGRDCCGSCDGGLDQLEVVYTGTGCVEFDLLHDDNVLNQEGSLGVPHQLCDAGGPGPTSVIIQANPGDKLSNPTEAFEPGGGPLVWSLHTSCSSPIFEGLIFANEPKDGFGLLFKVGANTTSVNGGQIAEECLAGSCNSQAGDPPFEDPLFVTNQFGNKALLLDDVKELCVPSEKRVGNCALDGEFCNDAAECCVVGSTCDANLCTDPGPAACVDPFQPCVLGAGDCCDPGIDCGICVAAGTGGGPAFDFCFVFDPAGQPCP